MWRPRPLKNALVIGYGSIGKLHCNVLASMDFDVSIVSRHAETTNNVYRDLKSAFGKDYDYVVIASTTDRHHDDLKNVLSLGYKGRILVEKPLFQNERDAAIGNEEDIYVGYNLRYFPGVQQLR